MGDLNIDLLNFAHHDKTNSFIDSIFSLGYLPLLTKPTRIAHTSATLLDHIYSNSINDQTINGIVLSDVSDHFGIFHLETSYLKKQPQTPMLKRTYSERNIDQFNSMLTASNFQDVLDMNDPELAYSLFMDKYKYCFNECFPEKLTKLKINKKICKKGTVDDG